MELNPELMLTVRWSKGSCGNPGCKDASCVCALCAKPIGVPEDDPIREIHDEDCFDPDCVVCGDDVPTMLFRGEGKDMQQAAFHQSCFKKLLEEKNANH